MAGTGDAKENLIEIGVLLLTFFQQTLPRLMAASCFNRTGPPPPPPDSSHIDPKSPIMQDMNVIGDYLEREMQLGRLRRIDVVVLQMLLFGTFSGPFLRAFISKEEVTSLDLRSFAERTVAVIWPGITPVSE
jgi:hypothetical protein